MASVPPRSSASRAGSTRSPTGANRMAASSGTGGGRRRPAPSRAQREGQLAGGLTARHHVHLGALRQRHLRGQVALPPKP